MSIKLPAHEHLDKLAIPYAVRSFAASTEKGAANVAQALGFRERQMVKTLVFETDAGLRALVMSGGDQNAVSGLLKKALGSRNISLAKPEIVKEVTGYVIGSIPPFHWQSDGFLTLLEASLMEEPILGVGAGVWGNEILIEPKHLVTASNARIVNLTQKVTAAES
jgi:Cys-tRNA(Pro)/Cys-tRNA(Cys) deacylase